MFLYPLPPPPLLSQWDPPQLWTGEMRLSPKCKQFPCMSPPPPGPPSSLGLLSSGCGQVDAPLSDGGSAALLSAASPSSAPPSPGKAPLRRAGPSGRYRRLSRDEQRRCEPSPSSQTKIIKIKIKNKLQLRAALPPPPPPPPSLLNACHCRDVFLLFFFFFVFFFFFSPLTAGPLPLLATHSLVQAGVH